MRPLCFAASGLLAAAAALAAPAFRGAITGDVRIPEGDIHTAHVIWAEACAAVDPAATHVFNCAAQLLAQVVAIPAVATCYRDSDTEAGTFKRIQRVINRINQDVDRQDVYKKWYLARHILPLDD